MKSLKVILFLIIIFISNGLQALQISDSLLLELRNTTQNKEKILLLNGLARSFMESNIDSALFYSKQGLSKAIEIDYELGIAENAASMADYYIIYDSMDMAKEYYMLSAKYFDDLDLEFDLAQVYMLLGNIYLSQSNHSEALKYYQKSQHLSEENSFNTILPHIYNNTGIIYTNLGEEEKALVYLTKAYSGFKELGFNEFVAHTVSNIASIHLNNSKDSLALSYYNEELIMFKETNNLVDASSIYSALGSYQFDNGNYEKALLYYKEGYNSINNLSVEYLGPKSYLIVGILANMGRVYHYLGDNKKAIKYLDEAYDLATQNHYVNWIEFSTHQLSIIYEDKGDFAKALTYYKFYEQYGDTILSEGSIKKITQLEMQFEFDKSMKERQLEDALKEAAQQRKEFLYLIFIGLGLFATIIAILMYRNQKSKTSKIELKRHNLKLEHDKLQQELEHRNRELATNVMYLLSKNEFITSTAEKLTKAKMSFKKENQKIIQDVIRDLLLNSSKDVWKEFEVRFQEVHSDFYDNLNKKFPELTPNEKKISAFLRLNMSTKDICAITYQSVRSIDMARFRLRKKIGLDSDENLINFLSQF